MSQKIFNFLTDAVHQVADSPDSSGLSLYSVVQLLLLLSEIAHSASYPLCSSVFPLMRQLVEVMIVR